MDERRTGWVLILVLAGQLVVLALQGARAGDTFLESLGLRLVGPAGRAVASVPESLGRLGEGLRTRGTLLDENRRLRREVEDLKLRLLQLNDVAGEARRLGAAVRHAAPPAGRIRAVDVVYADQASWLRTLIIYTGGVETKISQPVLSANGLVGRVVTVAGPYAKVQLLTDRAAGVGAMIVRTRRQGIVRGRGRGSATLELDFVPIQAEVRPGDVVQTAGIDGVYPRGIPIGTVTSVGQGGQLFHSIQLTPAVDFSALDQVYLLDHAPAPADLPEAPAP